jgi:hypothetical protein
MSKFKIQDKEKLYELVFKYFEKDLFEKQFCINFDDGTWFVSDDRYHCAWFVTVSNFINAADQKLFKYNSFDLQGTCLKVSFDIDEIKKTIRQKIDKIEKKLDKIYEENNRQKK